jgi:ribose transport system ATP-binding protein
MHAASTPSECDAVAVQRLTKRFGATLALDEVALQIRSGTVHALLGENGAGKSTLVKVLSGFVRPDSGTVALFGRDVDLRTPQVASAAGIRTAFQEMTLIPQMTVAQNVLLGREPAGVLGQIRRRTLNERVAALLETLEIADVDPRRDVADFDLSVRQKIEIAKALSLDPKILLLDEPTSTLSRADVDWLGVLIARLRERGITVVFISHRMREVRLFCERLSVLRNGRHVGTFANDAIADDEVVRLMIGRSLSAVFPAYVPPAPAAVDVRPTVAGRDLTAGGRLDHFSFDLMPGELLGVGALQGMGQSELFLALFGMMALSSGHIEIDGRPVVISSPHDALSQRVGMCLLPEDRKTEALFLALNGRDNVSLPTVSRYTRFGYIDTKGESAAVDRVLARVNVAPRALYRPCSDFSGGNQQKIAIAKWLLTENRIMLMFDPTRGVDIGTKHEIYVLMREFTQAGGSILFYSTDVPELVNICDRVVVLYQGRLARTLERAEISEESIMLAALGGAA